LDNNQAELLQKIEQLNKFNEKSSSLFIFFWLFGPNTGKIVQVQNVFLLATLKFIKAK
jgi:hypothetical protein